MTPGCRNKSRKRWVETESVMDCSGIRKNSDVADRSSEFLRIPHVPGEGTPQTARPNPGALNRAKLHRAQIADEHAASRRISRPESICDFHGAQAADDAGDGARGQENAHSQAGGSADRDMPGRAFDPGSP